MLDRLKKAVDSNLLACSVKYLIEVSKLTDKEVIKVLSDRLPEHQEQVSVAWQAWYNREGWKIERDAKREAKREAELETKADDVISVSKTFNVSIEQAAKVINAKEDVIALVKTKIDQTSK